VAKVEGSTENKGNQGKPEWHQGNHAPSINENKNNYT
jgi:hypothetical protein